jgi:hypothetical protein
VDANTAMTLVFATMTIGLPAWAWRIHKRPATGRGLPKDLRILACLAFAFVGLLGLLSMFIASFVH